MQSETMLLSDDGELRSEQALEPDEAIIVSKRKVGNLHPDKIVLWNRPYTDPAGNNSVELFLDYIVDGWYWHLFMQEPYSSGTIRTKQRRGGPCKLPEEAISAAEDCYAQTISAAIANQKAFDDWVDRHKRVILAILGLILIVLIVLLLQSFHITHLSF